MNRVFASILASIAFAISAPALACSYSDLDPSQRYERYENIVLAVPVGISNHPRHAYVSTFEGRFRQTILWTVLVSWKGKYRPGDRFTTRVQHTRDDMCGDGSQHKAEIRLLYISGKEPYPAYTDFEPARSLDNLKYLDRRTRRS